MPEYTTAFFVAVGAALVLTPAVIYLAAKTGAMDAPDARKVHKKPIPRIGGIGIYTAFMIAVMMVMDSGIFAGEIAYDTAGLLFGGSLIALLGVADDYKNLPAKVKLVGQILAAAVTVVIFDVRIDFVTDPFGDYLYLEYLAVPVTLFWFVGLTNTVNLIDGLDGLAAGVAVIASVTIFLVALEGNIIPVAVLTAVRLFVLQFQPRAHFYGRFGQYVFGLHVGGHIRHRCG